MNINLKQQELIDILFNKVKEKYPEIQFLRLWTNPDDSEHILIDVLAPMEEEREIEMSHFASSLEADIDFEYGYRISILPENPNVVYI
ncbi:MAG: hypothetical protein HW421_1778 [Ignavibacteria bacterium]|nr:hypothetical protein [Ignavibacteria bacterium]